MNSFEHDIINKYRILLNKDYYLMFVSDEEYKTLEKYKKFKHGSMLGKDYYKNGWLVYGCNTSNPDPLEINNLINKVIFFTIFNDL